ncbi:tripartite tricarboxylate transporter substrate-binding protein [Sabulicella glaciei]|uniref:Tripartite tricarboxylate transporter substrate-binding protein n=1 Tax=Sabulicella glaciei TaxID=2984948 RepID=A0ABT3NVB6_9PROT|nr:tripartite tricarboxylate transporter substrate-binding protein [Roseococcus sp. MDT2-1-1]MCW8086087.1 tripartite tricarboxylate transporter substrate-binding protein [Roseococcus sp. MDT2-1-1]
MSLTRRAALVLPLLPLAAPAVAQQGFPSRSISLLIPFAAGGPTDMIARLLAEGMSKELGQPVAAENVTGAGGTIAAARVAQARPDGHTLLIHHIGLASAATLYRRLPFDIQRGLQPLGVVSHTGMVLVSRPDFPATDARAYLAAIRDEGEKLNLGHSGLGGSNQLCGMLVQHAAGRGATQIVFRGSAPAMTEMMAGRLDISCEQATVAAPFIRDGRIKGYAVTLPERVPGLDVPTSREAGIDLIMSAWHGLYAPAGTPPEVVARLSQAIRVALREERLRTRYAETLTTVAREEEADPAYHTRFLNSEIERLRPLILAAGQFAD